jgi:CO/xanthine dehydrogenase Mo-binding subunit
MSKVRVIDRPSRPDFNIIGKPVPRHDAWDKAFGKTKYADDFSVPGMLSAKVLRSEYPAARIVSINTADAERGYPP